MKKRSRLHFIIILTLCMSLLCFVDKSSSASEKVRLNKKQVTLQKGQKYKLKLRGIKGKRVDWSSSNRKVAAVKNGVVSTRKAGKCIITARYKRKNYKCSVNVKQDVTDAVDEKSSINSGPSDLGGTESAMTDEHSAVCTQDEVKIPDHLFTDINDFSNVVMEAQLDKLDKNKLTLKISNCCGTDITTDNYFILEVFNNNKWENVRFKEVSSFEETILVIKNNTDYVQFIDLSRYFGRLSKGRYRISKKISAANHEIIIACFDID